MKKLRNYLAGTGLIERLAKKVGMLAIIGLPIYNAGCAYSRDALGRAGPDLNRYYTDPTRSLQYPQQIQNTQEQGLNGDNQKQVVFDNYFFECNKYMGDLNKNDLYDINEFSGMKFVFKADEPITFAFRIINRNGLMEGTIIDRNKKVVKRINSNVDNTYHTGYMPYGPNSFKPGKYEVVWKMGNEVLSKREFEVE